MSWDCTGVWLRRSGETMLCIVARQSCGTRGENESDVVALLGHVHAWEAEAGGMRSESPEMRTSEALRTISSAFSKRSWHFDCWVRDT